ncbi:hypothetical protein EDD17DRAFT_1768587 [Pisolithus thermaeus]|nr:hypothetical protein EV401DRAFT_2084372 [Pisolithus croceorrhizus]KAI6137382.1 hypothetical protein F5141DRAFT_1209702 [Pisolithus sp. B1]KAI6143865.1 hypothetical protein EDD17DRAFT_1768587 [Pisolithus thermaeus]
MDHLIHPAGASPYIIAPYGYTQNYDGGDFFTYPGRKGWAEDIENYDFSRRTRAELNAFFQTWLFFGCLTEVPKVGGVQSVARDCDSNALRTTRLILCTTFGFIDLICGTEENDHAFGEDHSMSPLIPLDPEIALSISALGSALLSASDDAYE